MKKILMLTMCLALVPMLFGADIADDDPSAVPDHNFTAPNIGSNQYTGSRSTPTLVDVIDLTSINLYCFGLTYDWDRDGLWVAQFLGTEPWVYCIQKTSPCTKIDSFQLVGAPGYFLGIGYAGGDVMYAMGYDGNVYEVDMTTGVVSFYRSTPWPGYGISCGFNAVDDVLYGADWGFDECGYAQPAQSGTWNTWALLSACGASGAHGTSSPEWLFTCNEDASQAQFFQHSLTAGIPNTTPDSVWECDPSQSQASTADCTFDGQYVYVLDQGDPDNIFVYDVGFSGAAAGILYVDDDDNATLSGYFETSFSNLGIAYDIWVVTDSGDVTPDASVMGTYDIVVWTTGDDWSSTFVGNDTTEVANYLAGGGKMWLSSEDILYDLGFVSWLHVASYSSDVGCAAATGIGPIMTGTSFTTTGGVVFDYSDEISPDAFAWTEMQNETPVDNTIAMDTTTGLPYFLFFNTFPFENIDAEADRDTMMQRIIGWMTATPTYHDVGTAAIVAPGAVITPNTPIDPTATYHNYGTETETFDIYFMIDSTGVNVYTDNVSVTVDAGLDTTHAFTQWAGGFEGITYDITAYTVLSGDENPGNDTLYSQTTATAMYWEILDPPGFPLPCAGHQEATIHDGYYYVFGMQVGGAYSDTVIVYDIANNQWLDGTTNPYGASRYGTCNGVNGKFYRLGGTAAWPTPLQRLDILDPPNTWSAGATPPNANMDQITGVYKDSLLFSFGGGQWSVPTITDVYFYDTYLDSWTTCTSFPDSGHGALAGGIIDSFAILAFGYVSAANGYSSDYCVGIIDQSNPSNITWGSWIPTGLTGCRRVPSGADEFNKVLWVIGGQVSGGQLDRTLSYDPYTDVWTDWAMPKPAPICNVTPLPITTTAAGDIGVFVGGGYTSGYVDDHEVFHTGAYVGIVERPDDETTSSMFGFAPNMPNPTKGFAPITYTTIMSGKVSMNVYDNTGRLVRTLVDRAIEPAGTKTVYWNHKDNNHREVANGIYFIRLEAEENTATHKLVLVK